MPRQIGLVSALSAACNGIFVRAVYIQAAAPTMGVGAMGIEPGGTHGSNAHRASLVRTLASGPPDALAVYGSSVPAVTMLPSAAPVVMSAPVQLRPPATQAATSSAAAVPVHIAAAAATLGPQLANNVAGSVAAADAPAMQVPVVAAPAAPAAPVAAAPAAPASPVPVAPAAPAAPVPVPGAPVPVPGAPVAAAKTAAAAPAKQPPLATGGGGPGVVGILVNIMLFGALVGALVVFAMQARSWGGGAPALSAGQGRLHEVTAVSRSATAPGDNERKVQRQTYRRSVLQSMKNSDSEDDTPKEQTDNDPQRNATQSGATSGGDDGSGGGGSRESKRRRERPASSGARAPSAHSGTATVTEF